MDQDSTTALHPAERRTEPRCRGKRDRPLIAGYAERVSQAVARIEIDLKARRFGAAQCAIQELERQCSEVSQITDDTALADTSLADHPRILALLERQFSCLYVGELRAIEMDRMANTKLIGRERMRILADFLGSIDLGLPTDSDQ